MVINNAVMTAYKNTGATENLAGNTTGNTQLAKEMDTWNVPPAQMAKVTNHTEAEIQALYDAVNPNGKYASKTTTTITPTTIKPVTTMPGVTPGDTQLPGATTYSNGAYGNYGSGNQTGTAASGNVVSIATPGDIITNPDKTRTIVPNLPGRPYGGFTGISSLTDAYTAGGGSTGYFPPAPKTMADFNKQFNTMTGDSVAAYNFLMGKGTQPLKTTAPQVSRPYREAVMGLAPKAPANNPLMPKIFDPVTHQIIDNPAYKAAISDASGTAPSLGTKTISIPVANGAPPRTATQLADYPGFYFGSDGRYYDANNNVVADNAEQFATVHGAKGGLMGMAHGGVAHPPFFSKTTGKFNLHSPQVYANGGMAMGGLGSLGGYSDGGRLLRGPGDGVSDSIPASIGNRQPARLADGEFVVPARIVSEIGNGSTEAGARKLYAMMDRVQNARAKTTGKGKVATNTDAAKYLPV
jgi:hypothetical protein